MYAGADPRLTAKMAGAFGEPDAPVSPRAMRSSMPSTYAGYGAAGPYDVDWGNRDESLYFGVPAELETSSSDINSAYAEGRMALPVSQAARAGRVAGLSGYGAIPILPLLSVAGGILGDNKDPQRLAQNQTWYQAAIKGDRGALANLYAATGTGPPGPNMSGGWATQTAQNDALAKYNAARQVLGGNVGAIAASGAGQGGLPAGWVVNWTGDGTYVYLGSPGTGNVGRSPGSFDISQADYSASHPGWYNQLIARLPSTSGGVPGSPNQAGTGTPPGPTSPTGAGSTLTQLLQTVTGGGPAPTPTAGGPATVQAGMFGGSSLVLPAAIGLGALLLSKAFSGSRHYARNPRRRRRARR
jgi:hypothetical protein